MTSEAFSLLSWKRLIRVTVFSTDTLRIILFSPQLLAFHCYVCYNQFCNCLFYNIMLIMCSTAVSGRFFIL